MPCSLALHWSYEARVKECHREHGLWAVRYKTIRMPTEDLSFKYVWFIHTNIPYDIMLAYKSNSHLTKWGRAACCSPVRTLEVFRLSPHPP